MSKNSFHTRYLAASLVPASMLSPNTGITLAKEKSVVVFIPSFSHCASFPDSGSQLLMSRAIRKTHTLEERTPKNRLSSMPNGVRRDLPALPYSLLTKENVTHPFRTLEHQLNYSKRLSSLRIPWED